MANILLKDKNGANIVYRDIDYLSLSTAEGGTVRFNERTVEVISVTELPAEEINDGAVYKVTTKDENDATIVKFYVHDENGEWSEIATGAKLSEKAITENGEYVPEGSYDGFSKVTVDIDTFTDVEEFPMENINQEAIYRVVRQDEETGTTYTTYGIFDADDTKTVLEYNAEEGWVECGGRANLTELVATANGVYDNPQIIVEPNIAPGSTIQFKKNITINDIPVEYHNISNPADNMFYAGANTIGLFMVQQGGVAIETMHTIDGTLGNTDYIQLYVDEVAAGLLGASIGITAAGWYKGPSEADLAPIDAPECIIIEDSVEEKELALLTQFSFLFGSISPADGWNKVTVNIPNADTIVEVDELPASGVDSDKIYKKVVAKDTDAQIFVVGTNEDGVTEVMDILKWTGNTMPINFNFSVVDSMPESLPAADIATLTMYGAIIASTGEAYMNDGGNVVDAKPEFGLTDLNYGGAVIAINEMTEVGCYYFLLDTVNHYGISTESGNKVFGYTENGCWEESGAGYRLMNEVTELPTENIDDNKVYCIRDAVEEKSGVCINMGGSPIMLDDLLELFIGLEGGTSECEYYVVDELPSDPKESLVDQSALSIKTFIYIMAESGESYTYENGEWCALGESGILGDFTSGGYRGKIVYESEATEQGYYTLMRDASVSYIYGIPGGDNKTIMVYKNGTWVKFVEEVVTPEPEEPTDPEATT